MNHSHRSHHRHHPTVHHHRQQPVTHHSHYYHHPSPQQHPHNRPTMDPNYYDSMFNTQTRSGLDRDTGNNQMVNYNLFAPKYENHQDSSGRGDTWSPRNQEPLPTTKRDTRVPFPSRTAPPVPIPQERFKPGDDTYRTGASHPLEERQIRSGYDYRSPSEQVESFNRTLDSMHLPESMQRPIPTRNMIRSAMTDQEAALPKVSSEAIADRQFSLDTPGFNDTGAIPLSGGGNFADMFY